MWLVTASEMQAIDRDTIAGGHVPSLDLMERAGSAVAQEALRLCGDPRTARVVIVCGKGNNGGDGLVAARHLAAAGVLVRVHLTDRENDLSPDARACAARLAGTNASVQVLPQDAGAALEATLGDALGDATLCIDALLGTGAQGAPRGRTADAIAAIARAACPVLAVDIASGVNAGTGEVSGAAVRAQTTVTFGAAKVGHAFHPGRACTGRLVVADIGFPPDLVARHAGRRLWVDHDLARRWLPAIAPTAHKYARGSVVVVAGSRRYTGAAVLASEAALRAGAGLVHLVTPESVRAILQSKLTEAIVHGVAETPLGTATAALVDVVASLLPRARALVVGPGLDAGAHASTQAAVSELLARAAVPAVVDADAVLALRERGAHAAARIATPHAGELERWCGEPVPAAALARLAHARQVAARFDVVLLAKGAPTVVTTPGGDALVNSTGHEGLASAGTGDVLAGVAGALLAGGAEPAHAAALAAWLHGRAAEVACHGGRARRSLLARDLLCGLQLAIGEVES